MVESVLKLTAGEDDEEGDIAEDSDQPDEGDEDASAVEAVVLDDLFAGEAVRSVATIGVEVGHTVIAAVEAHVHVQAVVAVVDVHTVSTAVEVHVDTIVDT